MFRTKNLKYNPEELDSHRQLGKYLMYSPGCKRLCTGSRESACTRNMQECEGIRHLLLAAPDVLCGIDSWDVSSIICLSLHNLLVHQSILDCFLLLQ